MTANRNEKKENERNREMVHRQEHLELLEKSRGLFYLSSSHHHHHFIAVTVAVYTAVNKQQPTTGYYTR